MLQVFQAGQFVAVDATAPLFHPFDYPYLCNAISVQSDVNLCVLDMLFDTISISIESIRNNRLYPFCSMWYSHFAFEIHSKKWHPILVSNSYSMI